MFSYYVILGSSPTIEKEELDVYIKIWTKLLTK